MNDVKQLGEDRDLLDDLVKPAIYSKRAIWAFSFFFTPLFGGILLMLNLKDIGRKRQANIVLAVSVLMTIFIVALVTVFNIDNRAISFALNAGCAAILSEYFYKTNFPDEADYEKKKVWKPLIIGILIFTGFILLTFLAQDQQV